MAAFREFDRDHDGFFSEKEVGDAINRFVPRPAEFGPPGDGFPGGHLCSFDPKTGFSRSLGMPVKQEGLMGGASLERAAL